MAAGVKFGGYPSKAAQDAAKAKGLSGIYARDIKTNQIAVNAVIQSSDSDSTTTSTLGDSWSRLAGDALGTNINPWENTQTFPSNKYAPNQGFNSGDYATPRIDSFNGRINPDQQMQNTINTPDATKKESWFNKDNMSAFASGAAGLGSLASGWAALKNLKLSRQALENQQSQWQSDYDSQRLVTNNQIANQNAWKQAQGRTDYGSYVGGKPAGTNYVG